MPSDRLNPDGKYRDTLTWRHWHFIGAGTTGSTRVTDLSHWDFAEHFASYDAAALILGFNPSESPDKEPQIRVVQARMKLDYKLARGWREQTTFDDGKGFFRAEPTPHPTQLESVHLTKLVQMRSMAHTEKVDLIDFSGWLKSSHYPHLFQPPTSDGLTP